MIHSFITNSYDTQTNRLDHKPFNNKLFYQSQGQKYAPNKCVFQIMKHYDADKSTYWDLKRCRIGSDEQDVKAALLVL